ncbi:MAG: SDR family NAD(P)-dependent oxidoreductase, partial [Gammaproteobacteria bacterium]|nr:SDR family NAD(P)-dependent oxidoreductase [Gammaproteobacteria bacterium]
MTLRNRVALITGSSSGIGRGVALGMAAAGADIIINHPSAAERDAAEQVAAEVRRLGRRALVTCADVSEANEVELMVAAALAAFGKIDILVNNAGIAIASAAHEMPIDLW